MKTFLPLSRLSILLTVLMTATALAQVGYPPAGGYSGEYVPGADFTRPVDAAGSPQHFQTRLSTKFPGNVWFGYTGASEGLGWNTGGFFTLGTKTRLGTDLLDGRWLLEARGHLAHENGNVFGNLGIERIFTIKPAKTDVGFNFFVDVDGDQPKEFGHTFWGLGMGGFLRHEKFEVRANGYVPVGETGYVTGDLENCFFGHNLLLQPGIDSSLAGFDVEFTIRPWHWQMCQGHLDVGGYYYADPDVDFTGIDPFGGVRVRGRVTTLRGVSVEAEYNYDDRYKGTIIGRIVISAGIFGNFGHLGQDLDRTIRNDHVVRVNQTLEFVINPATGRPYQVQHVDNTAAAGGDGSFEAPFDELADADARGDIILVRDGDGTSRNYDTGITLRDQQLLLGDGVEHMIPVAGGGNFVLCNDNDGAKPIISGPDGSSIIQLGNGNTVAGVIIDGRDPAAIGIEGNMIVDGVTIRDNMFMNLAEDGIQINTISGDITITGNMFVNIGDDAVEINDVTSIGRTMTFSNNVIGSLLAAAPIDDEPAGQPGIPIEFIGESVSDTSIDDFGIVIDEYVAENTWIFTNNTIMNTGTETAIGGSGIALFDGVDIPGLGGTFRFANNMIDLAGGHGIDVTRVADNEATFFFGVNTITNGGQDGIHMEDFAGTSFLFSSNVTSANVCNGVLLEGYTGLSGDFDFLAHVADENSLAGIAVDTADGDFLFLDSQLGDLDLTDMMDTGNEGPGIRLFNVTNTNLNGEKDQIVIDETSDMPGSIIQGNGIGSEAGVRIVLDDDVTLANPNAEHEAFVTISNSVVDANGVGIRTVAEGNDADLDVLILNNDSISNNRKDGIVGEARDGGRLDIIIASTVQDLMDVDMDGDTNEILPQMILNNGTDVGTGIRLVAFDEGTNLLTELNALIQNNTVTGTGGDGSSAGLSVAAGGLPRGTLGNIFNPGNANANIRVLNNTFSGAAGDIMLFHYDVTNTLLNTVVIEDNSVTGGVDGIDFSTRESAHLDIVATNNNIQDPGGDGEGFSLNMFDESRARLLLADNIINDEDDDSGNGIELTTRGTSRLLADVVGNSVSGFGFSGNRNQVGNVRNGTGDLDLPDPAFARGILIAAFDATNIAVNVINNQVNDSALEGIGIFSGGIPPVSRREFDQTGYVDGRTPQGPDPLGPFPNPTSTANVSALVLDNNITMSDQATVTDTSVPSGTPTNIKLAGRVGFRAEANGTDSTLCLALHNNYSQQPYIIREDDDIGGVNPTTRFEDGDNYGQFTELFGDTGVPTGGTWEPPIDFNPPSTVVRFDRSSSTCISEINLERALFETAQPFGFGFPTP